MAKITAKVVGLKSINDREVILLLDCNEIWGKDEIFELKLPIRIVAELFDLDKKDVEKSHNKPYEKYPFSETKDFLKDKQKILLKNKRLILE